ncbi:unnamed protein product [Pleuronectes platessa]|uniref:Uncharacterized protein n=1 Tax=Pleuronectes platessa TaxID=8262 RepID=A0A9N7Z613_PLEPL|nr:unnamed protein product [Pleuronectes platessa]
MADGPDSEACQRRREDGGCCEDGAVRSSGFALLLFGTPPVYQMEDVGATLGLVFEAQAERNLAPRRNLTLDGRVIVFQPDGLAEHPPCSQDARSAETLFKQKDKTASYRSASARGAQQGSESWRVEV